MIRPLGPSVPRTIMAPRGFSPGPGYPLDARTWRRTRPAPALAASLPRAFSQAGLAPPQALGEIVASRGVSVPTTTSTTSSTITASMMEKPDREVVGRRWGHGIGMP